MRIVENQYIFYFTFSAFALVAALDLTMTVCYLQKYSTICTTTQDANFFLQVKP